MQAKDVSPNRVDIKDRPAIVEKKSRIADWDADTIIGVGYNGIILTVVDRKLKLIKMVKVGNETSKQVTKAIKECLCLSPLKDSKTITFDNGGEFSWHERVTKKTGSLAILLHPIIPGNVD